MSGKIAKKPVYIFFILFAVLLVIATVVLSVKKDNTQEHYDTSELYGKLVITDLNVGKADAAVIQYGDLCGIIDTGTSDAYKTIKKYLKDNSKKDIDFMMITHYDKDHVGSAVKLTEKYNIKKIYLPDYVSSKSGYKDLMEAVMGNNNVVMVSETVSFSEGELDICFMPPSDPDDIISNSDDLDNDMSLLCMITYGKNRFLLAGDIEEDRIAQILELNEDIKADWLKYPHHGGYEENTPDFLAAVSPTYCVISNGDERPTDDRVLKILEKMNLQYFSTIFGSVITVSDGEGITVNYY